ncbi:MAG: hypothetical protein AAGA55_07505 [Planctomycetota bacterium]
MTPIPFQPARSPRATRGAMPPRAAISRGDPRWLLAARVQLLMWGESRLSEQHRDRLLCSADRLGFAPIHAAAIITAAERACQRGGLDYAASVEIAGIPGPRAPVLLGLARWCRILVASLVSAVIAMVMLHLM